METGQEAIIPPNDDSLLKYHTNDRVEIIEESNLDGKDWIVWNQDKNVRLHVDECDLREREDEQ